MVVDGTYLLSVELAVRDKLVVIDLDDAGFEAVGHCHDQELLLFLREQRLVVGFGWRGGLSVGDGWSRVFVCHFNCCGSDW